MTEKEQIKQQSLFIDNETADSDRMRTAMLEAYEQIEDNQFNADLGVWQCFGGKEIMLKRQDQILREVFEWDY